MTKSRTMKKNVAAIFQRIEHRIQMPITYVKADDKAQ